MEFGSEKSIIPVNEINAGYVIPKKAKEEISSASNDQHSVINNSYYNLAEHVERLFESTHSYNNVVIHKNQQKRVYNEFTSQRGPIYSDSYASDLYDTTLPTELKMLFQPLYCKLCSAQLSSTVVAKTHYTSKNHHKKVTKFLIEHSLKTGEPLHKRAKVTSKESQEDNDPKYFHCYVCDLPLTGKIHAESHYMGKNHQKALIGKTPAGKGRYADNGKWIRTQYIKVEPGNDGFGTEFLQNHANQSKFTCDICCITVTSQQQLDMHITGQKHKKKLSSINLNTEPSTTDLNITEGSVEIYSKYRTPSGLYYCEICNISVNSEIQFRQHLGSRKHMKRNSNSQ